LELEVTLELGCWILVLSRWLFSNIQRRANLSRMTDVTVEASQNESQLSDTSHDKASSFWIVWITITLLLGYPLSVGPVAKYYGHNQPPRAVTVFYAPLESLYHKSSTAHSIIDWYLHLWRVK
jgi:hypothetical protein